jgi:hypothetical protein
VTRPVHPAVGLELARARAADLVAEAERSRRARMCAVRRDRRRRSLIALVHRRSRHEQPAAADSSVFELRLRYALATDSPALSRLAAFDERPVPDAPLLVAEVDGELRAALSLWSGQSIADPFHRTAALVELLAVRSAQLTAAASSSPPARRRSRWAPLTDPSGIRGEAQP